VLIASTADGGDYRRTVPKDRHQQRRYSATSSGSESPYDKIEGINKRHHWTRQGRSPRTSRSRSPPNPYARHQSDDVRARDSRPFVKLEDIHVASPAFERRQRRYKQAAREADAAKREKDGKKPFYIILTKMGYLTARASPRGWQKLTS